MNLLIEQRTIARLSIENQITPQWDDNLTIK